MLPELSSFIWGYFLISLVVTLMFRVLLRGGRGPSHDGHDPFVIDGDTIVSDRVRIRLSGIDAPEMSQPGGSQARTHLIRLIAGGAVRIEPIATDRYGRTVARVHAARGDLGRIMVRDGYARAAYGAEYAAEEREARRTRAGLWAGAGISSPAAHRAQNPAKKGNRGRSGWT
jgi:endonuclease YncB( thermonuclease family)